MLVTYYGLMIRRNIILNIFHYLTNLEDSNQFFLKIKLRRLARVANIRDLDLISINFYDKIT